MPEKKGKVMVRRVIIESFRRDLPEETKDMTDDQILDMVRHSVWETEHEEIEFVDQEETTKGD
jgi:hypothetical protein